MQLVCADNGVLQLEKVSKTNCSMCINESQQQQQQQQLLQQQHRQSAVISPVPSDHLASLPVISKSSTTTGQPFYVCTVTCCDSVNCTKPSTTSLISKAIVSKADSTCHPYGGSPFPAPSAPTAAVAHRVNGIISPALELQQSAPNCPACVKTRQNRPRLVLITNPSTEYMNGDCGSASSLPRGKDSREGSVSPKLSASLLKGSEQCIPPIATPPLLGGKSPSPQPAKQPSIRRSPKLQLMGSEKITSKALLHSPELSSSPPVLGNSSFTDYTEPYTPVCTSVNSNAADGTHFKFGISRKPSPLNSEYSFYFANVENHGFFRKAVPALPISMAVLLCFCNLILPGSGTLIASFSIIFGSQTEYGPGYGCRSFSICFLSALLQFSTAIFVFGWVWSIMWGIVFIKNSLRYGEKRDIHTISLC